MSGIKPKIYYWDSCVYLAWILGEQSHDKACIDAMARITKENFELKNIMFTSTLTFTEVTYARLDAAQIERFQKSFRPESHIPYDVDKAIADKARVFRERFFVNPKKLSTPDAIHLATAVIGGADEFHTFDDGQKDKKTIGLLELSGDSRVDGLVICKPNVPQSSQYALFDPPSTRRYIIEE